MGNEKTMTCSKKCLDIPVWRRYTLTIEEAAGYYHIGEGKLRMLIDEHPNEDFYVMNGNRALIKCFMAASTSLRSRPLSSAILPALRG